MNRIIKYTIPFILLVIIIALCAGYVLRPKDTDICIKQIKTFHDIEENSLDVIVYGSSHSWLGFDAVEFEKLTGYKTYNYSDFWQSFNTTWAFFHDSLETQKPQIALIDTGRVYDYLDQCTMEGQSYYCRKLHDNVYKFRFFRQSFKNNPEPYLAYFFPIIAFHSNWESFEFKRGNNLPDFNESKGQNVSESKVDIKTEIIGRKFGDNEEENQEILELNEYIDDTREQSEIREECLALMEDISNVCRENNIRVIWYTTPFVGNFMYSDALYEYAKSHNEEYINFFDHLDEMGIDGATDLADADHLNDSGARKLSEYMADYIMFGE